MKAICGLLAVALGAPAMALTRVPPAARKSLEADRDRDRIPDHRDACPDDPEAYNGVADDDGCPDKGRVVRFSHAFTIAEKVPFAPNSAVLTPEALVLVEAVAATLKAAPRDGRVAVQGHVVWGERADLGLARARVVAQALVARGVRIELSAQDLGRARPACATPVASCRNQSRRVELQFLPPAPPSAK